MLVNSTTIEIIFARMIARYGAAWFAKWDGVAEPEIVGKDWLHALGGLPLWSVDFALENMPPDYPPNAAQFRVICMRAPKPVERAPQLPAPKPDPVRLKKVFERMRQVTKDRSPTAWIGDLEARQAAGDRLSSFQQQCLDNARANLSHRVEDVHVTSEDSRRTDELKRAAAARVAGYLRDHPELTP